MNNRLFFYWGDSAGRKKEWDDWLNPEKETEEPRYLRFPARLLPDAGGESPRAVHLEEFGRLAKERGGPIIAVIGASYKASRDEHWAPRPWGKMPGALLVANSLATMAMYGRPLQKLSWLSNALIALAIITAFSAIFTWGRGRPVVACLCAALILMLCLTGTWVMLRQWQTWFNFVLPVSFIYILSKTRSIKFWLFLLVLCVWHFL